jgi:hypothetical protein
MALKLEYTTFQYLTPLDIAYHPATVISYKPSYSG